MPPSAFNGYLARLGAVFRLRTTPQPIEDAFWPIPAIFPADIVRTGPGSGISPVITAFPQVERVFSTTPAASADLAQVVVPETGIYDCWFHGQGDNNAQIQMIAGVFGPSGGSGVYAPYFVLLNNDVVVSFHQAFFISLPNVVGWRVGGSAAAGTLALSTTAILRRPDA